MEQKEISIIMPIYNTGIYLEECLESLFAQTFQKFELLCVNDGSTDNLTLQLLECYQNKYSQMKVIDLGQNVGAGEARNRGFKEAAGKYVIFLDSDDIYAKEFLEKMYSESIKIDADVCECGFIRFDSKDKGREPIDEWRPNVFKLENRKSKSYFLSCAMRPTNKLCKKDFLLEHNIYFQSLSSCNDVFFSLNIAKKAERKAYIIDSKLVKVRINISTQISANRDSRNLVYAVNLMEKMMKQEDEYDEFVNKQLVAFLIFGGLYEMKKCRDENKNRECYLMMRSYLQKNSLICDDKILYSLSNNILNLPFESHWFEPEIDYLWELRLYSKELTDILQIKKEIFLWGLGKRGNAFQQFCQETGINIVGVTDKMNINVGNYTKYGNKILHTKNVFDQVGIIVASNEDIYDELIRMHLQSDILNLEKYCPF